VGGVGDQVLGTALLLLCICAITDRRNMQVGVFNMMFTFTIIIMMFFIIIQN
jgi:glycerol uptake facilitator-like aquaporin